MFRSQKQFILVLGLIVVLVLFYTSQTFKNLTISSQNPWADPASKGYLDELKSKMSEDIVKLEELIKQIKASSKANPSAEPPQAGIQEFLNKAEQAIEENTKGIKPRHVLFSTGRSRAMSNLEQVINRNSRLSAMSLDRVQVLYFDDSNPAIGKNQYGYPMLKDMYLLARSLVPDADTYTYFNHDLIFNASFLDTMDAAVYAARENIISSKFLIVGPRWNLDWKEEYVVGKGAEHVRYWEFEKFLKMAKKFQDDAEDYFVCSRDLWDWKEIPPFVIGRVAYDNWLVHKAVVSYPEISPIDATLTSPVIHQTGTAGNFQGHQGRVHADVKYNTILGKGEWTRGQISACQFRTQWDDNGKVIVAKK